MDIKTSLPDRGLYVEKSMCVCHGNLGTDIIVGMIISIMGEEVNIRGAPTRNDPKRTPSQR
jgi:hypothetical protein